MAVCKAQIEEASTKSRYIRRSDCAKTTPITRMIDPYSSITRVLPIVAFKDDILMSFLASKLLGRSREGDDCQYSLQCGLPTRWLAKKPQEHQHKSWHALAAIVFGQAHNMHDLTTGAYIIYGQALSDIRNELSTAERRLADETLASMTALYMYEMLASKIERAWMSHANGIGVLLELRGPSLHKPSDMKGIFLEHRIMLVGKSIISRHPTFLQDPIWKTVPWEDAPASKSDIDYLVDIGADITQYNSDLQRLNEDPSQEPKYLQLLNRVASSIEELNTWWRQWEAEHPHAATEVTSTPNSPLFPTILEYGTLWEAFTICFHNAMRILLLQLWDALKPHSAFHPVTLNEQNCTALLGITSNTRGLACEILRSLRYSYKMSRRFVYTFSFLVISDVTYGCFDRESREARWISEHGWAELHSLDDIEDANLLQALLPLGQIRIGK